MSTTDRDYEQEGARPRNIQNKYGDQLDNRNNQQVQDNSRGGNQ
ncbi:hypothetical protein [Chlamydia buteonis]